jgi:hypothetical protein
MKKNTLFISFAALCLLLLIVAFIVIFASNKSSITSNVIPAETYLTNPLNLEGNTYRINAVIISQITNTDKGRVLMVQDSNSGLHIPVIIPYNINDTFHPQQRYTLEVFNRNGVLYVQQIQKR